MTVVAQQDRKTGRKRIVNFKDDPARIAAVHAQAAREGITPSEFYRRATDLLLARSQNGNGGR